MKARIHHPSRRRGQLGRSRRARKVLRVNTSREIDAAFETLARERPDIFLVGGIHNYFIVNRRGVRPSAA
jgi:hypothetical protein